MRACMFNPSIPLNRSTLKETALHSAAKGGSIEIAELLLDGKADINSLAHEDLYLRQDGKDPAKDSEAEVSLTLCSILKCIHA